MTTKIVAAAVRYPFGTVTLPQPARHHDVVHGVAKFFGMNSIAIEKIDALPSGQQEQGFLTSEGNFVDRVKGARIAIEAGQIESLKWPPNLFSEDLW